MRVIVSPVFCPVVLASPAPVVTVGVPGMPAGPLVTGPLVVDPLVVDRRLHRTSQPALPMIQARVSSADHQLTSRCGASAAMRIACSGSLSTKCVQPQRVAVLAL